MHDTLHERIIRTAKENICKGVIEEPRIFYDEISVPEDGTIGFGAADVFKNGEQYPVKIHWMTCAIGFLDDDGQPITDERLIQRVRLRFTFHGQDYMRRAHVLAPVWHNRPAAAPDSVAFGQSSMRPELPWILSARDSLLVRARIDGGVSEGASRTAAFAITGVGLDTSRPYFKAAELDIDDALEHPFNPALFRNDGDEPILVTECAAHLSAESNSQSPQGDIRPLRLAVRQQGNGTQADWVVGPPNFSDLAPAVLFGTQAGRAVVHQWPPNEYGGRGAPGLYWEPGEGIQVEVRGPDGGLNDGTPVRLVIALVGSLVVA